jgi:hypothetical protein
MADGRGARAPSPQTQSGKGQDVMTGVPTRMNRVWTGLVPALAFAASFCLSTSAPSTDVRRVLAATVAVNASPSSYEHARHFALEGPFPFHWRQRVALRLRGGAADGEGKGERRAGDCDRGAAKESAKRDADGHAEDARVGGGSNVCNANWYLTTPLEIWS